RTMIPIQTSRTSAPVSTPVRLVGATYDEETTTSRWTECPSLHAQRVLAAARVRAAAGLPRWPSATAPLLFSNLSRSCAAQEAGRQRHRRATHADACWVACEGNMGADAITLVAALVEASNIDTMYRDLYLGRAQSLLSPVMSLEDFHRVEQDRQLLAQL